MNNLYLIFTDKNGNSHSCDHYQGSIVKIMCINRTEKQTQQHTDNSTKQQNETGKDPVAGLKAHSGGIVKYNSIHLNLILM